MPDTVLSTNNTAGNKTGNMCSRLSSACGSDSEPPPSPCPAEVVDGSSLISTHRRPWSSPAQVSVCISPLTPGAAQGSHPEVAGLPAAPGPPVHPSSQNTITPPHPTHSFSCPGLSSGTPSFGKHFPHSVVIHRVNLPRQRLCPVHPHDLGAGLQQALTVSAGGKIE